jgi:hypothetical protein
MTRRNLSTNPFPADATLWSWQTGTGEAGATTVETGTGPDGQAGFLRRTVTTAKTGGNSGMYRNEPINGAGGGVDDYTSTLWVRSSVAISLGMNLTAKLGAATVTGQGGTLVPLSANVWTKLSTTVLNIASSYDTVQSWVIMGGSTILPVGATLDVARNLLEAVTAPYSTYYDGNTPTTTDPAYSPPASTVYAWDGAPGSSTSTLTKTVPLQNYQIQLPDGTAVGAGCPVGFTEVTNLRGSGELRDADLDVPDGDGALPGLSLVGAKTVGITFSMTAPAGGLEAALGTLVRNWQNVPDPGAAPLRAGQYLAAIAAGQNPTSALQFQLPGRPVPLLAIGRPGKLDLPVGIDYQYGQVDVPAEWKILDGLVYDATVNTATANLPMKSSAATFPLTFPISWGQSSNNTLQAVNAGNYTAKPVFVITGPATTPRIVNVATGQYLRLNLTLVAGDVVVINTQSKSVKLNGANRNNALDYGSTFHTVPPGGAAFSFASQGVGTEAGQLTAYTLNTYSTV